MAVCKRIRNVRNKVCSGDLDTPISLQRRELLPPAPGELEGRESFTDIISPLWSFARTVSGVSRFSRVNINENATHLWYVRYDPAILTELETGNNFISYNNRLFRILEVTNDNETDATLIIQTRETGDDDKDASDA